MARRVFKKYMITGLVLDPLVLVGEQGACR